MVSKEDREAYERGRDDAKWESDHPISSIPSHIVDSATGGSFRGSKSEESAYDKGHSGEQLDDNCSSGCHITTACLEAMGLPMGLEMRTMKELTREHILKTFSGKREFVLYGRKAPAIVQAIEARSDAHNVWERVYDRLKVVTSSVLSKDYETAHGQYRDLVLGLEREFVLT